MVDEQKGILTPAWALWLGSIVCVSFLGLFIPWGIWATNQIIELRVERTENAIRIQEIMRRLESNGVK